MTVTLPRAAAKPPTAADRVMLRMLRITATDRSKAAGAHRALRTSMIVSGLRCLVTYIALPLLAPVVSVAGVLATPLGILLSLAALVSGTISLRRFWVSDHRGKWMYTAFVAVIFAVVAITLTVDITKLVQQV